MASNQRILDVAQKIGYSSYEEYLASPAWSTRKEAYAKTFPKKCYVCGETGILHLHHVCYDRLGSELDSDLIWLCEADHALVHSLADRIENAHDLVKTFPKDACKKLRQWISTYEDKGLVCPCCNSFTKVYKRKLNKGMVQCLIVLAKLTKTSADNEGWVRIGKKFLAKEDCLEIHHKKYAKLRYWGLIEQKVTGNNQQTETGKWRITKDGYSFLKGTIKVPERVFVKHTKLVAVSEEKSG